MKLTLKKQSTIVTMALCDYRESDIEYLTDIVEDKKNHRLDVWISAETVSYLPTPLSNLDTLHSMMVPQTFGER